MKRITIHLLALTAFIISSCQKDPSPTTGILLNDSFTANMNGWEGEYADYGTPQDSIIKFKFEYVGLPNHSMKPRKH